MPLYLSDDQLMLADTVRPFLAELAPVSHLRSLRDAGDPSGFSLALWRRFGEMGFTGVLAAEADGGLGLGHVEAGVILEEIGRNLTPSPFLATAVGTVTALQAASEQLRRRWLPPILAGEAVAALAIDETPRHRPERIALRAQRTGNGFRLSGEKRFVLQGHVADLLIVAARTDDLARGAQGLTLFAVERASEGLESTPERLADASIAARLAFHDVQVAPEAVIGEAGTGWPRLSPVLDAVRVGAAAELVGLASGAFALTLDHLKARRQFDRPIGSFQALQHRAAHLYAELEVARAAVLKAQQLLDARDPAASRAAHVAKAVAGLAATLAVQEGVQMHGGVGMTDEYAIGLYMKRARVLCELFGDADFHADQVARIAGF